MNRHDYAYPFRIDFASNQAAQTPLRGSRRADDTTGAAYIAR